MRWACRHFASDALPATRKSVSAIGGSEFASGSGLLVLGSVFSGFTLQPSEAQSRRELPLNRTSQDGTMTQ
jgi:hypothetical protein